ncbi:MAG: hypothetical protein R2720_04305 [Candidatus Nanopelagicales bacterium]
MSPTRRGRNPSHQRSGGSSTGGPPDLASAIARALEPTLVERTPLQAELLLSHVLGTVWAGVDFDRPTGVEEFVAQVASSAPAGSSGQTPLESLASAALAVVADRADGSAPTVLGPMPRWTPLLDTVELVDAIASIDIYGDQTNYVMLFGYRDGGRVLGRHVVIAMVDHNLHLLKDAFVLEGVGLEQLGEIYAEEPDLYVHSEPDLAWMAGAITRAMDLTDMTLDVVDMLGEQTADTWYLLRDRVRRCLPEPAPAPEPHPQNERDKDRRAFLRAKVTKDFLATEIDGQLPDLQTVDLLSQLFIDYACDYGRGHPDAWSPIAVELFLVDFAPRKVVWQADDIPWVVPTLKVFVEWAQKRRYLVVRGRRETQAAIDQFSGDFVFRALGGAEPSPARGFMEDMLAAGVDPTDKAAMDAYVEEYNRRITEERD